MSNKTPPIAREVAVKFKEELTLKSVKALSLRDRWRLLLGYNIQVTAVIQTEHRVGRTHQGVRVELTTLEKDPEPKDRVVLV